jgi:hypothetical protein
MSTVIADYQRWNQQGESLRTEAKVAMETRFRDLLVEAAEISEEYKSDFGKALKPPPSITSFRYKAAVKAKPKKAVKSVKPKEAPPVPKVEAKPDPKIAALQKRLATARKKLEDAKAAGQSNRTLEDKVYELEDDLKLATAGA